MQVKPAPGLPVPLPYCTPRYARDILKINGAQLRRNRQGRGQLPGYKACGRLSSPSGPVGWPTEARQTHPVELTEAHLDVAATSTARA